MSAQMKILGWKVEGLRCPDHEVSFCKDNGQTYSVSLIQMPNGAGKTTTLNLLRRALSGSFGSNPNEIKELRKRGSQKSDGFFEVRLLLNAQRVTITMLFNFDNNTVVYKTTTGRHGQQNGFSPPVDFRQFLNADFVNFFVFDGELAANLLSRRHTDAEAAAKALFQLNLFAECKQQVESYWLEKIKDKTATKEQGLSQRKNRLERLRKREAVLIRRRDKLLKRKDDVLASIKENEKKYQLELDKEDELSEKLREAESTFNDMERKVREHSLDLLDSMRDPHALSLEFAEEMLTLKEALDRAKLPESAAKEWFQELAREDSCVCGRPIDDEIRLAIKERSAQYLASDSVSMLNSMKTAIDDAVGLSLLEANAKLKQGFLFLEQLIEKKNDAQRVVEILRLEAEEIDPSIKEVRDQIDRCRFELADLERDLKQFSSREDGLPDDKTLGIRVIRRRIAEAEDRVAEITNTLVLRKKKDTLGRILAESYIKARSNIFSTVKNETNKRIADLLPYNNISVSKIDGCLHLEGQEGGSVGETLSIAYAFLSTLFNRSEHTLPFVVDSPAGPIDLATRPNIGSLVPLLTDQFIAFTISSERDGFVPAVKIACRGDIQYLTLFRDGQYDLGGYPVNVTKSMDGVCVQDEAFFNDFQMDQESEPYDTVSNS